MATIDWGNTRAPINPQQTPGPTGQGGYSNTGSAPVQGQQQQGHQHWSAAGQAHHVSALDPHLHYGGAQGQGEFGAPPAYAHTSHMPDPAAPVLNGGGRFGAAVNYAGAAVSLGLIVGLAVWGYQLAMRDVTGIPVVRALEGPMRIQPVEPGGQSAAHQGLAVNSVQAEGEASAPSDQVALAPAPEKLDDEDLPAGSANLAAQVETQISDTDPILEPIEVAAHSVPDAPSVDMSNLPSDPVAAALAIASQVSQNIKPLSQSASSGADVTRVAAQSPVSLPQVAPKTVKVIPASVPGVSTSARPLIRPSDLRTVSPVKASLQSPVDSASKEITPDAIPAGTRLVQLGAFESAEVARSEWDKLSTRFDDYLPGKTRVIQKAQSGGKTFYRLRAMGFKDLADARRFCSALMAGKTACIPVVTR
ncbi:SPOR domain-containing protein [Aliiroseovarius crassostreae]|uniref:SPOR domain-containing protein n=1 Tax=Aliiroseovarius crassostreae TaxID=154981 RepID=UPI00220FE6A0|nr:SPOR domain-containing protein [Aliiroseovarius crassostreae]UWQ03643.1 SPOR domain-containing protein [Aliiroseovarius crassostreae]